MEPITREEMYLAAAAGYDVTPPEPITRKEFFLAKLAGMDVPEMHTYSREEMFLEEVARRSPGAVIEPLMITENGTYTSPEGVDGYNPVAVNVSAGVFSGSIKATGTWNERCSLSIGFDPDFILIAPKAEITVGDSNFLFWGVSSRYKEATGKSAFTNCIYLYNGKTKEQSGGTIDSTDANTIINRADATGFNFGKMHPAGSYYVFACKLF